MSGSIPIPFAVGETAWHACCPRRQVEEPCPDCAGTLRHEVHLGCGEVVKVWCQGCGARWLDNTYPPENGHPGIERRWVVDAKAEQVTLASVQVNGDEVTYYGPDRGGARYVYYAADLFRTEAEALERAKAKAAAQNAYDDEQFAGRKKGWSRKNAAEKAAYLAGYWKREAKRHDEEAAKARERMARCEKAAADLATQEGV